MRLLEQVKKLRANVKNSEGQSYSWRLEVKENISTRHFTTPMKNGEIQQRRLILAIKYEGETL